MSIADARTSLLAKTRASQKIAQDRAEVLNSGLAANLEMPHPVFIERGQGPYVFDADGNQYIDTSVGFGLAHARPRASSGRGCDLPTLVQRLDVRHSFHQSAEAGTVDPGCESLR